MTETATLWTRKPFSVLKVPLTPTGWADDHPVFLRIELFTSDGSLGILGGVPDCYHVFTSHGHNTSF